MANWVETLFWKIVLKKLGETIRLKNLFKKLVKRCLKNLVYKFGEKFIGKNVLLNLLKNWVLYFILINWVENCGKNLMEMLGWKIVWKKNLVEKVYSVMCTFNSAPQFVEEALVLLCLGSYLANFKTDNFYLLSNLSKIICKPVRNVNF